MSPSDPKAQINAEQLLNQSVIAVQREIETIMLAFKERGAQRFGRILGLGLGMVALSYWFAYAPAKARAAGVAQRIAAARATAQYADRYKALRERLNRINSLLPVGQSDGWLLDRVRETLASRNLVSDAISPPQTQALDGYSELSVRFSMTSKFPDLAAWLNDLEFGKGAAVHVTSLGIDKQATNVEIGSNRINCVVASAVPGGRATP